MKGECVRNRILGEVAKVFSGGVDMRRTQKLRGHDDTQTCAAGASPI